mmetsp:Transcript_37489/g.67812  ORF Transcript_37489/g.67812 Transcript_37489/m.67812 type:complete len:215 (-) Transcript_37489:1119-1763(-)
MTRSDRTKHYLANLCQRYFAIAIIIQRVDQDLEKADWHLIRIILILNIDLLDLSKKRGLRNVNILTLVDLQKCFLQAAFVGNHLAPHELHTGFCDQMLGRQTVPQVWQSHILLDIAQERLNYIRRALKQELVDGHLVELLRIKLLVVDVTQGLHVVKETIFVSMEVAWPHYSGSRPRVHDGLCDDFAGHIDDSHLCVKRQLLHQVTVGKRTVVQ